MFCEKCGKEIESGSRFCTHCGAPVGSQPAAPLPQQPGPAVRKPVALVPLAKAAVFVVMIFLWFGKLVNLSVMGMERSFSMLDMSEGMEWLSYLTALILAVGAVCSLFPRFVPKLKIPMLAAGWTAFWFIASVFTASKQLEQYSSYNPQFTVTFAGWLLGILSVGMLIVEAAKKKPSVPASQKTTA